MRLTDEELAEKYDTDFYVVMNALTMHGNVSSEYEVRNGVRRLTYDENEATEAIGSYIAERVHESYEAYQKWQARAKKFDKRVIDLEDEWIPLYEKMPESGDKVYVRDKDGSEFPATYRQPIFYHPMGFTINNVAHWKKRR